MLEPRHLDEAVLTFLTERHLATLTTTDAAGRPHVTPVGFTFEPERALARVITWSAAHKVANIVRRPEAEVAVCQVDGGRWLTLRGPARVTDEPEAVAEGVRRYTARYRPPKQRDDRVVIEIDVVAMMGRA